MRDLVVFLLRMKQDHSKPNDSVHTYVYTVVCVHTAVLNVLNRTAGGSMKHAEYHCMVYSCTRAASRMRVSMVHRFFFISLSHELKFHHERRRPGG